MTNRPLRLFPVVFKVVFALYLLGLAAFGAESRVSYHLPAGDASSTLKQFIDQSGVQVFYIATDVSGVRTNSVSGEFSAREALVRMLAGTSLRISEDEKSGALAILLKKRK